MVTDKKIVGHLLKVEPKLIYSKYQVTLTYDMKSVSDRLVTDITI